MTVGDNIVLTCLFTAHGDPQRPDTPLPADPAVLDPLLESLTGCTAVVLHDQLDAPQRDGVIFERVKTECDNPYFARWPAYSDWLDRNRWPRAVFCVDGTDVEMLHEPWHAMAPDVLYLGSEPATLSHPWFIHCHPTGRRLAATHPDTPLLNPGLVGGYTDRVAVFLDGLVERIQAAVNAGDLTDMAAVNVEAHIAERYGSRHATGEPVHTEFRANDRTHPTAWWRHK